ncbi:response regulator [Nesterenkonia sp. E16_7]|uniref:response regulator n=1 Tax=unclassified Nesterenkonia TaxID=2629769 RepID=UPI001A918A99|nr:response regulator [Nesterenkonia sp. E16_10]MBO0598802.1 response regulator [Nesterenkonia sp. E16_7]
MSEQTPGAGESASAAAASHAAPETAAASAAETAAAPAAEAERGAAPRRVLVAEDETLIRLDIVEILTGAGYDVVGEADNGERAVELARETEPDLVVMDVKMPIMDGITAAQLIAEERIAPVVMLTAFSQRDLVESAREAGAMAYVVKPFTENDLIPAIEVAMARFDEIRALEDEVTSLADKFETRKLVERAKSLLTTKMGLTEPEAFRWIQKTSMDRRLSMREVAETVVDQMTDSPPYLK